MTDPSERMMQEFHADLTAQAVARGIELTPELMQRVFSESWSNGFTPNATRSALDGLDVHELEDEYDDDDEGDDGDEGEEPVNHAEQAARDVYEMQAGALQRRLGRDLTDRENREFYDAFTQGSNVNDAYDRRQAQLDTRAGRHDFYRQRFGEDAERERAARIERIAADREFDLSDPGDRRDYLRARADGAEFVGGSEFEGEPGGN